MATRLCPSCGATYLEWVTTCADCGVDVIDPDLIEDPRQLPEDDQLVYELGGWTLEQRTEVAEVMANSGIPHAWEGEELFVHVAFEGAVDQLLEPIEGDSGDVVLAQSAEPPSGDLTEYDLGEWSVAARAVVADQLVAAGVSFGWEGSLLLVSVDDEEAVDDILDELEANGDLDEADEDAETPGAVLEMLFVAADRLRKKARDSQGAAELDSALALVVPKRPPFGIELRPWQAIVERAEELSGAAADEAENGEDDDEASIAVSQELAEELRDLLRPFI